jgi:hypothetical protein
MSILLSIAIVFAIIIAALLITAAFIQKEYAVKRQIVVNQPQQIVFEYIKFLRNQDSFSKWATIDLNMTKEYRGTDGAVGFVSAWNSDNKKVGKGEQEIIKITEGERIDSKIRFIKPFQGKANAFMSTESAGENKTRVIWGIESGMKYPMNIMLLFMDMDKVIGNDLEVGLTNLKKIQEKE